MAQNSTNTLQQGTITDTGSPSTPNANTDIIILAGFGVVVIILMVLLFVFMQSYYERKRGSSVSASMARKQSGSASSPSSGTLRSKRGLQGKQIDLDLEQGSLEGIDDKQSTMTSTRSTLAPPNSPTSTVLQSPTERYSPANEFKRSSDMNSPPFPFSNATSLNSNASRSQYSLQASPSSLAIDIGPAPPIAKSREVAQLDNVFEEIYGDHSTLTRSIRKMSQASSVCSR